MDIIDCGSALFVGCRFFRYLFDSAMDKLEKYYNQPTFKGGSMPEFADLSSDEKERLRGTLGFAFWSAGEAVSAFAAAVKRAMPRRIRKVIRRHR